MRWFTIIERNKEKTIGSYDEDGWHILNYTSTQKSIRIVHFAILTEHFIEIAT